MASLATFAATMASFGNYAASFGNYGNNKGDIMNKYTVWLQNGNTLSIEAEDYFVHDDWFYFSDSEQNQQQAKRNPIAQFRYDHVSGIVRVKDRETS